MFVKSLCNHNPIYFTVSLKKTKQENQGQGHAHSEPTMSPFVKVFLVTTSGNIIVVVNIDY